MAGDRWHPNARALWERGVSKPGAEAVTDGHGHTVFKVRGKTFVYFGAPDDPGLSVKLSPGTRTQLKPDPAAGSGAYLLDGHPMRRTHYIGQHGWVDVEARDPGALRFALDLIDESYEQMAPKRMRGAGAEAAPGGDAELPRAPATKRAKASASKKRGGRAGGRR